MSKIRKLFDSRKKEQSDDDSTKKALTKTPKDVNEIFSEVTSMIGVLSLDIFDWSGNVLYSYYRWGKSDNILEEEELFDLIAYVKKRIKKIGQKELQNLIIKSEDMNIVVNSTDKIITIIHCENRTKLPLLTIHSKRATTKLSKLILDM
ncbi:MAG: hypothetical protein ACTSPM_06840 [Candidatus Heimdallarchaeota archaeon]